MVISKLCFEFCALLLCTCCCCSGCFPAWGNPLPPRFSPFSEKSTCFLVVCVSLLLTLSALPPTLSMGAQLFFAEWMPPFPSSPVFSLSELGISHLGFPGTPFSNILSFRLFVTQALLPGCWFGKCCPNEVSCTHVHLGNWNNFWGQGLGSCLFS